MAKNKVIIEHLGLIDYKQAWDYQEELLLKATQQKLHNKKNNLPISEGIENRILVCQHPHVYTLGKSGLRENLLISEEELAKYKASFYKINRGGDITYHGPGQLVMYPIIDLEQFFTDIHKYLRLLEEAVIETLEHFGILGDRFEGYTGVWIEPKDEQKARKICAMGIRCSRWVTMHGIALNVNSDLDFFKHIVPCGIKDKDVTSMALECNGEIDMDEVESRLLKAMEKYFEMEICKF